MAMMQLLECMVAVGGDQQQIVHRGEDSPVTYPEMLVLAYIHGDDAVTDAHALGAEERDNASELDRLRITYGAKAVADVFPGAKPRLPTKDSRITKRTAPTPPKRVEIPSRVDRDDGEGGESRFGEAQDTHDIGPGVISDPNQDVFPPQMPEQDHEANPNPFEPDQAAPIVQETKIRKGK